MLFRLHAATLNEVTAAGGDAAPIVDVARAMSGSAGGQAFGVADLALSH